MFHDDQRVGDASSMIVMGWKTTKIDRSPGFLDLPIKPAQDGVVPADVETTDPLLSVELSSSDPIATVMRVSNVLRLEFIGNPLIGFLCSCVWLYQKLL